MSFSALHLPPPLLRALSDLGFAAPTQIQAEAIPLILAGKDLVGQSQTGSGKTAAFGLPMLARLQPGNGLQALVLTPTRELCIQVCDALRGFARHMRASTVPVFGGVGITPQAQAARTADVIVATPGRLLDLMERGLRLGSVRYLVLDEADRMLDMGFIDDVERILRQIPRERQTVLFSATLTPRLQSLVHRYMADPAMVQTKPHVDAGLLAERAYSVGPNDKLSLLAHCLKHETSGIAIVFCKTRHGCDKVAKRLRAQGIDATPIHGGLAQTKRMHAIETLHKRGIGVLIATDVASRGLHIDNISHVYNYDIPATADDYVHRIGRTARAGAKGDAITLVTSQDGRAFKAILREVRREVQFVPLPAFEKIPIPPPQAKPAHQSHGQHPQGSRPAHGHPAHGRRPFWKRRH
jgi:superfamily II DNA/RNA helicase